jgi:HSP20 family protein
VPEPRRDRAATATAARQPIAEVFEEGDEIVVVAELPGADPARITCTVEGSTLSIEASGAQRYRKSLALPARVTREGLKTSFQNGILEVRLQRETGA